MQGAKELNIFLLSHALCGHKSSMVYDTAIKKLLRESFDGVYQTIRCDLRCVKNSIQDIFCILQLKKTRRKNKR
jgi:hypothetical protein